MGTRSGTRTREEGVFFAAMLTRLVFGLAPPPLVLASSGGRHLLPSALSLLPQLRSCAPCRGISTGSVLCNIKMVRRDRRRRELVAQYEGERLRLRAIIRNRILPEQIQSEARKDLTAQPRDACLTRVRSRCVLTGRSRGVVRDYRLSRMKFRQFADFGMLSGVTRSSW